MKTSSSRLITERASPTVHEFQISNFKLKTFTVMIALLVCETTSYNFYSLIASEFCSA